jgi:YD repeat-containing protein
VRKLLLVLVGIGVAVPAAIYAGPLSSGALWLLLPDGGRAVEHNSFSSHEALHKGGVHLGTGLYIRNDEDLIVPGTPALILRRTYLSGYRVSREFGIGTTHNGELYLVGDPDRFQWIALILPDGAHVRFERTSPGVSFYNAMFEHRSSPSEWQGARLGWIGSGWALKRLDGTIMRFQSCTSSGRLCSIVEERDGDGHTIHYRRNPSGQLVRMEAQNRWIAFSAGTRRAGQSSVRALSKTATKNGLNGAFS